MDFGFWIGDFGLGNWNLELGFWILECGLYFESKIPIPNSKIKRWLFAESKFQNQKSKIIMNEKQLKDRTKDFAKEIIRLCRLLPDDREGRLIGNQIFRSGTSIAANYRAACRAKSTAGFVAKLAIVEEEADETIFWLEMLSEMQIVDERHVEPLMKENNEIIAIIVSSIKTARQRK